MANAATPPPYHAALAAATATLVEALLAHEPELEATAPRLDERVRELLREVGRRVLQALYARLAERVTARARAAGLIVQRRPRITVLTLFGPIPVHSPYLWAARSRRPARPVSTRLGLRHQARTPAVERALTDFGAEESFAQASRRFAEHYGFPVGRTTVLRVVEGHARRAEGYVAQRLAQAREQFTQPPATRPGGARLLVELDGSELRTGRLVPAETADRTPGRGLPRRRRLEAWREARVGLARPLDQVDPTYVARLDTYPAVVTQLFDAACARGLSSRTQVVAVADGGNGLREELAAQFPGLRFILDRPHLQQHLYETAEAMGLREEARSQWVRETLAQLDAGQVDAVRARLHQHKGRGKARVRRLTDHLTRFQDAVHYEAFRAEGLPVSSGEVESAHRTVPQKRLKLPGAWWHPETVNPMLALRVVRANGWWDAFWRNEAARAAA